MVDASISALLSQVQTSSSPAEQLAALRALKNDVIGHPQRKRAWISQGVIYPIVRILNASRTRSRQNERKDESLRYQTICVVASLLHGEPAYLGHLHAASILPAMLPNLCPLNNSSRVVLATLRGLSNLAESVALLNADMTLNSAMLADNLFSKPCVLNLAQILQQSSDVEDLQPQISLVVSLISKLCREECHQVALASAGVLDALAKILAEIVVAHGLAIPGSESLPLKQGTSSKFSFHPAPPDVDIAGILEAQSTVIANSKFRASQLVYSETIMAVFPSSPSHDFKRFQFTRASWTTIGNSEESIRQSPLNAIDYMIPRIPAGPTRLSSSLGSAFLPLGSQGSFEQLVQLGRAKTAGWPRISSLESGIPSQDESSNDPHEPESPLIAYLLWLARSSKALQRLAAISVLAVLYRAGLTDKSREIALGLLIVPLLVQLVEDGNTEISRELDSSVSANLQAVQWSLQERASAVLAMLIVDSEYLQKAAYDAGVISKLAKTIKLAYDPVSDPSEDDAWSPTTAPTTCADDNFSHREPDLALRPCSPLLIHRIRVREGALRAIAALVPFKDEYRKALIDQSVVPYLVESLKPRPDKPSLRAGEKTENIAPISNDGISRSSAFGSNPVSVLIAACGAVRHLSRSVSILRTTLIDNGVVMPVFALLQHPDIDVQIAATAAVCNFVTEFSPMRETIAAAGVLRILCEHAHSGNLKLRLNALWALKHLVHSADNEVKKTCLEELGQGWLLQLICDNTEDEVILGLDREDNDEQIDTFIDDMQVDQSEDDASVQASKSTFLHKDEQALGRHTVNNLTGSANPHDPRLAVLQDLETNPARRARKDDIAVQEQGLEFIRNLISAANTAGSSETSEMIDFIFSALGQEQIFEILASKLRSKVVSPHNRRGLFVSGEPRTIPPEAEIVTAVIYILVHMAASVPRHRQLLISHTDLLKLLIPQFDHPNKEVRVALCWLATNLTWMDDDPDHTACVQRAHELKRIGFLSRLENLMHDSELDVRERAKTAVYQMKQHGC